MFPMKGANNTKTVQSGGIGNPFQASQGQLMSTLKGPPQTNPSWANNWMSGDPMSFLAKPQQSTPQWARGFNAQPTNLQEYLQSVLRRR